MLARLSLFFCLLLAGCSALPATAPGEGPGEAPDVEGVVIDLLPDQRALLRATHRAGAYPDTFYVNPGAEVLVQEPGGSLRPGDRKEIRVGDRLRAWLTGVELRSHPPQYPAWRVEVYR